MLAAVKRRRSACWLCGSVCSFCETPSHPSLPAGQGECAGRGSAAGQVEQHLAAGQRRRAALPPFERAAAAAKEAWQAGGCALRHLQHRPPDAATPAVWMPPYCAACSSRRHSGGRQAPPVAPPAPTSTSFSSPCLPSFLCACAFRVRPGAAHAGQRSPGGTLHGRHQAAVPHPRQDAEEGAGRGAARGASEVAVGPPLSL